MLEDFQIVIGLEVHVQLQTETKLFCGCSTEFGRPPNVNTCPVCQGLPGTLPVLNERALEYSLLAARALNCSINEYSKFDRKNYFYPDLPKGYQISQYDLPLGYDGHLTIDIEEESDICEKKIGINRVHMEEDAGKLVHGDRPGSKSYSYVDLNRAGVPLIEIVSEPEMNSPREARLYLESLKQTIAYLGVSDCNMEEGSLRCDANISLRDRGTEKFGIKAEVKNMNSFSAVEEALSYEAKRQAEILSSGHEVVQETRAWDADRQQTTSMRTKEEAEDYRYFPEPDLMPLKISDSWIDEIDEKMPELPRQRCQRFQEEYNLPAYDAEVLTGEREFADLFEAAAEEYHDAKEVSNWLMGEYRRLLNENNLVPGEGQISPESLAELLKLVDDEVISSNMGKEVFEEMFEEGGDPGAIVEERGLKQISDEDQLGEIVAEVLEENPDVVEDILEGKDKAIGYLVGQVMQKTQGKANPQMAKNMLREKIENE
ncbi:Asp-tRNA(Asn)/Glu-tRNA(Gln) amidotransferase subunit GatB [Halarsenatibacter silvermanii]|uniref:Aspartyl/glutamyl-tRNA(Asn/Gln) amidotransferase subunit B n=1 Tax=Halarsenatibacter silvermanii TaxID=321763 RepID=A0A1G9NHC2_9FIRM|nr:Asp-tRNA(Asn)/Glu-tRNA(Gln) amidotransferase subunit GatB [Halarsenatibacter silvermanii]SDL85773.1 aspartyl/glutamyl-tRNA(Asn/Gln) amidotransferase subunit B [Halarsenatibacter silvermanii]